MSTLAQFLLVLVCILYGARFGAAGIGIFCALGLGILVMVFGVTPAGMQADIIFIIIAVCTCAAAMHAAGGLDLLVRYAARIIRSNPKYIMVLAPLVMFFVTVFAGTAMTCYALQPVVFEVAYANGYRPERALVAGSMAASVGITASPIAAATAAVLGLFVQYGHPEISLGTIMIVAFPAGLISVVLASLFFIKWGKDLDKDSAYQKRLKAGLVELPPSIDDSKPMPRSAYISLVIFAVTIVYIVVSGFEPVLRTPIGQDPIPMWTLIPPVMLFSAALIMIFCRPKINDLLKSSVLHSAFATVICMMGSTCLADTFVRANQEVIMQTCGDLVTAQPWLFAIVICIMGSLIQSQGGTTRAIMPIGFALGLSPLSLLAMWPCVSATLLPTNPIALAACGFDRSGTSSVGKYVIDNPFAIWIAINLAIQVGIGFLIISFL